MDQDGIIDLVGAAAAALASLTPDISGPRCTTTPPSSSDPRPADLSAVPSNATSEEGRGPDGGTGTAVASVVAGEEAMRGEEAVRLPSALAARMSQPDSGTSRTAGVRQGMRGGSDGASGRWCPTPAVHLRFAILGGGGYLSLGTSAGGSSSPTHTVTVKTASIAFTSRPSPEELLPHTFSPFIAAPLRGPGLFASKSASAFASITKQRPAQHSAPARSSSVPLPHGATLPAMAGASDAEHHIIMAPASSPTANATASFSPKGSSIAGQALKDQISSMEPGLSSPGVPSPLYSTYVAARDRGSPVAFTSGPDAAASSPHLIHRPAEGGVVLEDSTPVRSFRFQLGSILFTSSLPANQSLPPSRTSNGAASGGSTPHTVLCIQHFAVRYQATAVKAAPDSGKGSRIRVEKEENFDADVPEFEEEEDGLRQELSASLRDARLDLQPRLVTPTIDALSRTIQGSLGAAFAAREAGAELTAAYDVMGDRRSDGGGSSGGGLALESRIAGRMGAASSESGRVRGHRLPGRLSLVDLRLHSIEVIIGHEHQVGVGKSLSPRRFPSGLLK